MASDSFFSEATEESIVKATIVAKYFSAWAKVIIPTVKKHGGKIAYIDLFAGPGRYKDGTKSTPVKVIENAISDPDLASMLVTIFNDVNQDSSFSLENEISNLPGIEKLKFKPVVNNEEVGAKIVQQFEKTKLIPTLFFVDPWGYKGLSLRLINSVLQNWGCDCIFFFNYNRINMGINNDLVQDHLHALFGDERTKLLRGKVESTTSAERELVIVEELANALKEMGGKFVLPFCFKDAKGKRTSHYLIFVSKHFRGYEIMKGIMAKASSDEHQGVPSFAYCRATQKQLLLFELNRPLDDLEGLLLKKYCGCKMTMKDIYTDHNVDTPYIKPNYKAVLGNMETKGLIKADPPAVSDGTVKARRMNTFADHVMVSFP